MIPAGLASPNPAQNASIQEGLEVAAYLKALGFTTRSMVVGVDSFSAPLFGVQGPIPVAQAQAAGVTETDKIQLMIPVAGIPGPVSVPALIPLCKDRTPEGALTVLQTLLGFDAGEAKFTQIICADQAIIAHFAQLLPTVE